ncbi:hypothetical protein [Bulleidia sp. zg-1006]|uniref:hypothetical protein n=1 Tax=Bulleidia sp. zg-1006 TaxID=2806552 RepID=UPI0019399375|nr:hypothetical protein [Bulleidia sp. zg-1006]QRG86386.1 hypothetical protein JOS54_05900 [Bulleidia sp. zg-1006]
MNNYYDDRDVIQQVDRELRSYYFYLHEIEIIQEKICEIDAKLTSVDSPPIRNLEEAKYQRGTRIYSDINLLELFEEQDELIRKKQDLTYLTSRIQKRLNRLSDEELKLIEQRYKYKKTLREMVEMYYVTKSTMARRINEVLLKLK